MSDYTEQPATSPAARPGDPVLTVTFGDGGGAHDVADLVATGTHHSRLVCRCGRALSAAAYTLGYRFGTGHMAGRADILRQHRNSEQGLCVHCGRPTCWCAMTVGS